MRLVTILLFGAGCTAVAPPPVIPRHATTAPMAEGEVSAMVILGLGTTIFGGGGWGVEARVTWQTEEEAALGAGLSVAHLAAESVSYGDQDGSRGEKKHTIFSLRGFGAWNPFGDWNAFTGGVGLAAGTSGYKGLTLDAGVAGALNAGGRAIPHLDLAFAASIPLDPGGPWTNDDDVAELAPSLWYGGSLGFVGLIEENATLSIQLDLLMGRMGKNREGVMAISVAGGRRPYPPPPPPP
jgi:hypothetical protein